MRGGRPCLQAPEIEEIQEGDCPVTEHRMRGIEEEGGFRLEPWDLPLVKDRKSTRLNSSHGYISYAVFCLKKKKRRFRSGSACRPARETPCASESEGSRRSNRCTF